MKSAKTWVRPNLLSWPLWGVAATLGVVAVITSVADAGLRGRYHGPVPFPLYALFLVAIALGWATVGALISSHLPANAVGWIVLAIGLCLVGQLTAFTVANASPAAAQLGSTLLATGLTMSLTFLPLLFPTGHLPSRAWRIPAVLVGGAAVGALTAKALTGESALTHAFLVPVAVATVVCLASVFVRLRRAEGDQRLQLRWLAAALTTNGVLFLVSVPGAHLVPGLVSPTTSAFLSQVGSVTLVTSVGIAVLRFRLYAIDLVINRTTVYVALSGALVAIYLGVLGVVDYVLAQRVSIAASAVATLLVATLFGPLRSRIQVAVDRLMYGDRRNTGSVLAQVDQRVHTLSTADALLPALAKTIATALKLSRVEIRLHREGLADLVSLSGASNGHESLQISLSHLDRTIGQLIVEPRRGESLNKADRRFLHQLAPHLAVACHSLMVASELEESRSRLIGAREEERRRLRRDLHDGLGPTLAGLVLRIDLARDLIARDPSEAAAVMLVMKDEIRASVVDVRRLVNNLRPPSLDQLGLVPAVRQLASHVCGVGTAVEVEIEGDLEQVSAAVEVAAYRIIGEALTNVARHARARSCRVRLRFGQDFEIEVVDDGDGLPATPRVGVGLSSMRERAAELGGVCSIQSGVESGTRVCVSLPRGSAG